MTALERAVEEPAYRRGRNLNEEGLFELVTDEVFRDGQAGPDERRLLLALAQALRLDEPRARVIARRSRDRFHAGGLGVRRPFDPYQLYARVLRYCLADGRVDPCEKRMIEGLFRLFRLTPVDHQRILLAVRQDPAITQNAMPLRSRTTSRGPEIAATTPPSVEPASVESRLRTNDPAPCRRIAGYTPGARYLSTLLIVSGLIAAISFELWPCLLLVLVGSLALWRELGSHAALDSEGLTVHTPFLHREIPWRQMRSLSRGVLLHHVGGIFTGATVKITVWTRQGEEFSFTRNELTRNPGPYRQMYEEMFGFIGPHLLLEDLEEYQSQGALTFGTLSASQEGLRFPLRTVAPEGKLIEWRRVCRVWIDGGRLFLMGYGSTAEDYSAPVDSLPNSFSLLEILRQNGHFISISP